MYKMTHFKKACPVCCAVSKSLTKKNCDFCKTELVDIKTSSWSKYSGEHVLLQWNWDVTKVKK